MLVGVPLDSKDTEDSFGEFNRFIALIIICSGAYRSLDLEIILSTITMMTELTNYFIPCMCTHEG